MQIFTDHKWWWLILVAATVVVSIITGQQPTITDVFFSMLGHLTFAIVVSFLPWAVYRLLGNPLKTEEMMSVITVAWAALAVANLLVMP